MKYYGKSEDILKQMLAQFEQGDIPAKLAQVFVNRKDGKPSSTWSWFNQVNMIFSGFSDARGYRQWEQVERFVRKGETARCHILVPCFAKSKERDSETGKEEEHKFLYGFKSAAVFGFEQTDGKPLEEQEDAKREREWIAGLPLKELADSWEISVDTYNGEGGSAYGYFAYGNNKAIGLGVRNLSTWAHEMVHAAEHKLRKKLKGGQDKLQEIVAEIGGAVLLECLGYSEDSDRGGAWEYLNKYSEKPLQDCYRLISRICKAVDFILSEAQALQNIESESEAA